MPRRLFCFSIRVSFGVAGREAATVRLRRAAFETRSLPTLTRSYPRRFTFYVALPDRSIAGVTDRRRLRCHRPFVSRQLPLHSTATLAA
jgi:hypothetical protein